MVLKRLSHKKIIWQKAVCNCLWTAQELRNWLSCPSSISLFFPQCFVNKLSALSPLQASYNTLSDTLHSYSIQPTFHILIRSCLAFIQVFPPNDRNFEFWELLYFWNVRPLFFGINLTRIVLIYLIFKGVSLCEAITKLKKCQRDNRYFWVK